MMIDKSDDEESNLTDVLQRIPIGYALVRKSSEETWLDRVYLC